MVTTDKVLLTWFGTTKNQTPEESYRKRWFKSSPDFDAELREKFSRTIEKGYDSRINLWMASPKTSLALIILFDQFSRNIFRGSPEAFTNDKQTQRASMTGISDGFDLKLGPYQRAFYYMPLMHSEDLKVQEMSLEKFKQLAESITDDALKSSFNSFYNFAEQHYDPIKKFGRFPYRNKVLGRESTPEEIEYLSKKDSWP